MQIAGKVELSSGVTEHIILSAFAQEISSGLDKTFYLKLLHKECYVILSILSIFSMKTYYYQENTFSLYILYKVNLNFENPWIKFLLYGI